MLKKLAPLFLVILLAGVFFPLKSLNAAGIYDACQLDATGQCSGTTSPVCYEGIVPCGKPVMVGGHVEEGRCVGGGMLKDKDGKVIALQCQFCHLFIMIDGMIDYVLIMIVPPLTVLMLVVGGIMFYFGGVKPDLLSKSKTLFKGVIIGLILIYGAYMIVGIALTVLGAADVNPMSAVFNKNRGVFKIDCPIELPPP